MHWPFIRMTIVLRKCGKRSVEMRQGGGGAATEGGPRDVLPKKRAESLQC